MAQRAAPPPVRPPAFTSRTRIMVLLLAGGVIAAVVVFVVLFSSASFTATKASSGNVVAAGTASLSLSTTDPIIDASGMKPGSTRSGDITVTNQGERAVLSVQAKGTSTEPSLAATLHLKITPQGNPSSVKYDGSLAGATNTPVTLGTYAKDGASSWTLTLSLPPDVCPPPVAGNPCVDPSLGSKQLAADFDWMAQTP